MGNGKWGTRNGVTDPSNMQEVRHNVNKVIAFLHFNGLIASNGVRREQTNWEPCGSVAVHDHSNGVRKVNSILGWELRIYYFLPALNN